MLSQPLARSAPLWAQGPGFDVISVVSLCQAQMEMGVCFLWPHHSPTQNKGEVLFGPGWRSSSLGSGPVYDQGQGSSWEQGAGRSSPWSLPGQTQPRRVGQAVRLGGHRPSFRLLDWSRGSGEGDAQALWSTIRCVLRRGDLPPPPNILQPDNLPTRTLDSLCWSCSRL